MIPLPRTHFFFFKGRREGLPIARENPGRRRTPAQPDDKTTAAQPSNGRGGAG